MATFFLETLNVQVQLKLFSYSAVLFLSIKQPIFQSCGQNYDYTSN